jgi:CRISPR type III-A-associated RAMP protein Csm4
MPAGILVRLRPTTPWRIGPDSGDRDRVDRVLHSDSLYSAVASAMERLELLDDWLGATARAPQPAVRFSSCFPFHGETLFVTPPRNLWPPSASSKVRWKGARFVPLKLVESLASGQGVSEDSWMIDGPSECLIPVNAPGGPFRVSVRSSAAVDREGAAVAPHSAACLEFAPGSGLWTLAAFSSDETRETWKPRLFAALRLLGDSGIGGERSRGWGRADVSFADQESPLVGSNGGGVESAWWMLSLFYPAPQDSIDWRRGNYSVTTRGGRIESAAGWGQPKLATRMITEGSVLIAPDEPRGAAADVAPEGFAHPVYRAGYALAVRIPWKAPA